MTTHLANLTAWANDARYETTHVADVKAVLQELADLLGVVSATNCPLVRDCPDENCILAHPSDDTTPDPWADYLNDTPSKGNA